MVLPEYTKYDGLQYGEAGGEKLLLNLYIPKGATKPLPLIIYIHGGGWISGGKDDVPDSGDESPTDLILKFGYAAVSLDYRLASFTGQTPEDHQFPAQIHDVKGAIRWLRANAKKYNLDSGHFAVWGRSAGAHLASLAGTSGGVPELEGEVGGNLEYSSKVQAVYDEFGPAVLYDFASQKDQPGAPKEISANFAVSQLFGSDIALNKERAEKASPTAYATADDPPFLIIHGKGDTTVPYAHSEKLYAALQKAGVEATLKIFDEMGHGEGARSGELNTMAKKFFGKHLR